jgi:hypothetical protein
MLIRVSKEDGKLVAAAGDDRFQLKPLGPDRFRVEELSGDIEFAAQPGGGVSLKVTQGGGTTEGARVTLPHFGARDTAQYLGTYWSEELETQYTIIAKDGRLFAGHAHHGKIALTPVAPDEFNGSAWFMQNVKFLRDQTGRVTGMAAGGGRVKAIRFTRRSS